MSGRTDFGAQEATKRTTSASTTTSHDGQQVKSQHTPSASLHGYLQAKPPAHTALTGFEEHQKTQNVSQGVWHPLPPRLPGSVNAPSSAYSYYSGDGVSSGTSHAPSVSSSGRSPTPTLPGKGPFGTRPGVSNAMPHYLQSDDGTRIGTDTHQPRFSTPSPGPPLAFDTDPSRHPIALSPERLAQDLPARTRSASGSAASPTRPFTSFDPPPLAIARPEDGILRGSIVVPEAQSVHVGINPDPGRMVSSRLGGFYLWMHKGDSQTMPSYGRGESVGGSVERKVRYHIAQIEVTLQGTLQVTYSEPGMANDTISVPLFTETKVLYPSGLGPAPARSFPFAFTLPEKCADSNDSLPPTWSLVGQGVSAETTYTIKAVLKRKGLFRKRDTLSTKVEYYPRTAPPLSKPESSSGTEKPKFGVFEVEQSLSRSGQLARNEPMIPKTLNARAFLRLPLIYASGSSIPYAIAFSSPIPTSVLAFLDLEVSIIKISKVVTQKMQYERRDTVAIGASKDKKFEMRPHRAKRNSREPSESGSLTIHGTIVAGIAGHEMSWRVEGVATVSYILRFVMAPKQQVLEFPSMGSLPRIDHSVEIVLTTDETSTLQSDVEARLPARGLGHARAQSNVAATGLTSSGNSFTSGAFMATSGASGTSRANDSEMNRGDSPAPEYERTRLLNEHQRVTEQVRLWYHGVAKGAKATKEAALSTLGSSYRVRLVALNFELSETSLIVNENSTFGQVGFQLYSPNAVILPVALEHTRGPFPQWRIPSVDSKVPRGLQEIYVADINVPCTLALVRGVKGDSPLLLPLSEFNRPTVGELVGARLGVKTNEWASIRSLSGGRDVQRLSCEMLQKEIEGVYSTLFFVLLTDDPLAYRFRNTYDGRVPPPLQVVFPQCRNLVESAPRLKAFTFQAIDLSRALLHLAICLADAIIERNIEGPTQAYLISRLKSNIIKLKKIFSDIENSTDKLSPAIAKSLHRFFHELCEEQPGVVSVRYSFESFKESTPLDDEDVDTAPDVPGEASLVHGERPLGVQHPEMKTASLGSHAVEKDSAGSSDSLTASDSESVDSYHQPSQGPQKVGPRIRAPLSSLYSW